jgi:hypothetical protein
VVSRRDPGAGRVLVGYALPFALLAGARAAGPGLGARELLVAGVALAVATVAGAVAVRSGTALLTAGLAAGLLTVLGAVVAFAGLGRAVAVCAVVVLALVVVGLGGVPSLAVRIGRLPLPAVDATDPAPHPTKVFTAVRRADDALTGLLSGASAAAVAAAVPLATGGAGPAGRALLALAAVTLLLRARLFATVRHRVPLAGGAAVMGVALAAGLAWGLAAPAGAAAQPAQAPAVWGPAAWLAFAAVTGLAVVVVAVTYTGRRPGRSFGRVADVVDTGCVVAAVPLACAALGLYGAVRDLVG